MWKQDYYPPFEDSDYLGASHNWRYGFSMTLVAMIAGLAFAYHIIDANDGFNRPFGEPAKEMRGSTLLTNSSSVSSTVPTVQDAIAVKGFDIFKAVKNIAEKEKVRSIQQAKQPAVVKKEEAPVELPPIQEPVTAPRITP
ncbi:MAG TPA: hypothetical protein VIX80_03055 [Candidatus Kapabacteria bacterium]